MRFSFCFCLVCCSLPTSVRSHKHTQTRNALTEGHRESKCHKTKKTSTKDLVYHLFLKINTSTTQTPIGKYASSHTLTHQRYDLHAYYIPPHTSSFDRFYLLFSFLRFLFCCVFILFYFTVFFFIFSNYCCIFAFFYCFPVISYIIYLIFYFFLSSP